MDIKELRREFWEAKRDLGVFNTLNPVVAMGSGKWGEHGKFMNRVANARQALKEAVVIALRKAAGPRKTLTTDLLDVLEELG